MENTLKSDESHNFIYLPCPADLINLLNSFVLVEDSKNLDGNFKSLHTDKASALENFSGKLFKTICNLD